MSLIAAMLITLAGTSGTTAAGGVQEPNPRTMSQGEIRAFNASLDKGHKYFIRCKRSTATGSFVKRDVSCRTNEQWAKADARGNQEARDIGEEMQSKSWNTSGD